MSTIHRQTDGLIIMVSPPSRGRTAESACSHGRGHTSGHKRTHCRLFILTKCALPRAKFASPRSKARCLCDGQSDNGPIKSCAQRKVCHRRFYADDRLRSPCHKDTNRRVAVINCRLDYCQPCTQRQSNSLSQLCRLSTRFEPTVK